MKNLVKRAQLAKLAKVSMPNVTQLCRPGELLHPAVAGKLIDAGHPVVVQWLVDRAEAPDGVAISRRAQRAKGKSNPTKKTLKRVIPVTPTEVSGLNDSGTSSDASSWADLSLREVSSRFGGEPQFTNWIKALAIIETVRERRLKNEESEGSLIARSLVETHLLGLIEEQHQRLLTDLPKTLARTVRAHAQSNTPLEQSEREIRSVLGKTLEATKSKVSRKLKKV